MQELRRVRSGILSEKEKVSSKMGREWCVNVRFYNIGIVVQTYQLY